MDSYLAREQPAAQVAECAAQIVEFAAKDDDELDEALRAGRFERVVLPNLDALLAMIWAAHAHIDEWLAAGVRIDLAEPPGGGPADWLAFVTAMYHSLAQWRRRQRRRQIVAGLILSVLALASLAVLLLVVPASR